MMILQALRVIGRLTLRLTFSVMLTMLVLLALYVSLGRQLLPLLGEYRAEIEQRLSAQLNAQVSISSIVGSWNRFSPSLEIRGLQIRGYVDDVVDNNSEPVALYLERVSVATDIPASLLQRKLVLASSSVENLDINLVEVENGRWLLSGLTAGTTALPSASVLFDWITGLAGFELQDTTLTFSPLVGNPLVLSDTHIQFQSQEERHTLLLSGLPDVASDALTLKAELVGSALSALTGQVYLLAPPAEYAGLLSSLNLAGIGADRLQLASLRLHGEFWVNLHNSELIDLVWSEGGGGTLLQMLDDEGMQVIDSVSIDALMMDWLRLARGATDNSWMLDMEGLAFSFDGGDWPKGGVSLSYEAGNRLTVAADSLDAGLISRLLTALMPEGDVRSEIEAFDAQGQLQNLQLATFFVDSEPAQLVVQSNIVGASIRSHRGVPAFTGIDAYADLQVDLTAGQLSGFIEVDSEQTTMHIPRLFDDAWLFESANGRVNVQAQQGDNLQLRLSSSVIVVESASLSGRGQFALEMATGADRYINLELMVGALRADVSRKSQFLPMAAGAPRAAQGVLAWVDDAVRSGEGAGSGLIFRGMVHAGAAPTERTLQMFYRVADGELKFDPQWPALEDVSGFVRVNDGEVDVFAEAGSSLGINFSKTVAAVRANPGGGRWLTVEGTGQGSAQQGLQYLQETPVTRDVGQYLGDWQASGQTEFTLSLAVPLYIENARPDVRLGMRFADNELTIPEYSLSASGLTGQMSYSAADGLSSQGMTGQLFGQSVAIEVTAGSPASGDLNTQVHVSGSANIAELQQWPGLPAVLRPILARADGEIVYQADVQVGQRNQLRVQSDLVGVALDLPAPFDKQQDAELPLDLTVLMSTESTPIQITLGQRLHADLAVNRQTGESSGLVYLGAPASGMRIRRLNPQAPGIEVLGQIDYLNAEQWLQVWNELGDQSALPRSSMGSVPLQLTSGLRILQLDAFGEQMENLDMSVSINLSGLTVAASSEAVAGNLTIPADSQMPWQLDLEYLHLRPPPDEDAEQAVEEPAQVVVELDQLPTVEFELPREDPLRSIDPRSFPALRARVGEFTLGGAEYGSWQFLVTPDSAGALFTELSGTVRGIQLGDDQSPAQLRWVYDGQQHRSVLNAVLTTGDLAPVLSSFGYAPSLESRTARADARVHWDGSPAFFSALGLNGEIDLNINNGRFRQRAGVANTTLRLISIINFDAIIRRLRFSDDLARAGLAYDEITARLSLADGIVTIQDRLQMIGPSSLFQLAGSVNLAEETIDADLYITLPVSDNIPWLSGLAVLNNLINWQFAIGVFLFDRIFGDQVVDALTSAHYTLKGPWEGVEPRLYQVFSGTGSGNQ